MSTQATNNVIAMNEIVKAIRQVRKNLQDAGWTADEATRATVWALLELKQGAKDFMIGEPRGNG